MKRINILLILTLMLVVGFGKIHAQVVDVCAGNDTVELHLGNYRYGLVQWQVSDDNELWRDIDGAIDTVYRFLPERPRYYRAKVRFPKCAENDYLSQVSYVQTPPRANAGPDMSIPMGTVARLCASSFKGAEGEWHIIEGEYGFIEDASNPKSGFIGGEGEYKLTWTVTNSCGSNTDTVTVRCVKMEYQPGIVYVDETDAILSDSTQLVNGEYVIVFSDPVPDIQVGSVLLGYRTPSFLRKVVSFDRNGDLFVMQTEQGQLTDILLSGALCIDPIGDAEGGSKSSVKYIDRYPTRKEMLDNPFLMRDGSTYVVKNMIPNIDEKSDDWEVTAEIEDGVLSLGIKLNLGIWNEALDGLIYEEEVSLEPNMRVGIEIENGQLKECYYGYYNAVFSHTVSLSIDEEFSALEIGESGTINSSPIQLGYPFLVGGVPITIVLDFPVSLKISAALEGLKLSYTSSTTFTSAFEYDLQTHEFNQIREKQDPVETLDDLELNGTFGVKFQLGVKLSALVAGVTGPYAELRGTFNPSLCASLLPPYHSSADLNVGVDMDLGWRFHLFKDLLEADVCFNFKFFDHTEHAPKKITKFTGDNQVYTFGSYLETPITVDVSGWFDTRLPRARVHFEPEVGGEVSESVVIADAMGRASTLWKPNSPFGRDKLRVKAYDCHGDLTAGTPVVFHAYSSATDPCINANLTVEVYHVQEDRIIPQVSGGREPYMYSTDGESYSNTQPNIQTQPGHNYTFYVQDADGCEAMTTYNEPFYDCENSGLMLSVSASGNVIIATGYFGFEPYWYSIDGINYQPTGYFTPLLDGEYTIYVRDALGCVDTKHITVSREGNLYVWISEIDGHSGTAEVRTSTSSLADRGVCWSTHHAPTVEDLHASYGNNTGPFPFTIYGLDSETTYYVRAYALDLSGTSYSEERCINPGYGTNLPEVAATGITSVTQTSAVGSGNVTYEGDSPVTERGICWGTNHNPDISGEHIPCGSGIGAFTADITGLTSNTQYYARAYAINSEGTAYGEEVEFFTGDGGGGNIPQVITTEITDITSTTATCWFQVLSGLPIQGAGVCYSTHPLPTVDDYMANLPQSGDYVGYLSGLIPNTTYYVRAYAFNVNMNFCYGNELTFTTLPSGGGTHEYVDLGLPSGTLWATCNVGANAPEEYGEYFAWGETQPKEVYNWSTYQYCNGSNNTLTKYCNNPGYGYNGFTDNDTILLSEDDAATANWGNGWRIPTEAEWVELINNTTVTWTTQNGVKGRRFTASNGNSLFLPAAGSRWDSELYSAGRNGHYWSNSLLTTGPHRASNIYFDSGYYDWFADDRYAGASVRAVRSTPPSGPLPQVTTSEVILETHFDDPGNWYMVATMGGTVLSEGDYCVTERGVCWGMNHNPSLNDNRIMCGEGIGDFSVDVVQSFEDGDYYVRAYAINGAGISYGNEVSFFVQNGGGGIHLTPEGAINGLFSVGEEAGPNGYSIRKVYFSQGNLQYQASTNTWRFAENQWNYAGYDNNNISLNYDGWIDLFGWGTSGYAHGAVCYQPWSTSTNDSDYSAYGNPSYNLFDQNGQADWGYNTISNGGNSLGLWRTLTDSEWRYVLLTRVTSSGIRYAKAVVNGMCGLILLPDDWNSSIYSLNDANGGDYSSNHISGEAWSSHFETNGAVFLPAAGRRIETSVVHDGYTYVGSAGFYWSSSSGWDGETAGSVCIYSSIIYPNGNNGCMGDRYFGHSVRLVQDAPNGSGSGNGGGGGHK